MKLFYWGIQGLGELSRLSLAALQLNYEDIQVTGETWTQYKKEFITNGNQFVSLPGILDDGKYVGESNAIPFYLAQKSKRPEFVGKEVDRIVYIQLIGVLGDIKDVTWSMIFNAGDDYKAHFKV